MISQSPSPCSHLQIVPNRIYYLIYLLFFLYFHALFYFLIHVLSYINPLSSISRFPRFWSVFHLSHCQANTTIPRQPAILPNIHILRDIHPTRLPYTKASHSRISDKPEERRYPPVKHRISGKPVPAIPDGTFPASAAPLCKAREYPGN